MHCSPETPIAARLTDSGTICGRRANRWSPREIPAMAPNVANTTSGAECLHKKTREHPLARDGELLVLQPRRTRPNPSEISSPIPNSRTSLHERFRSVSKPGGPFQADGMAEFFGATGFNDRVLVSGFYTSQGHKWSFLERENFSSVEALEGNQSFQLWSGAAPMEYRRESRHARPGWSGYLRGAALSKKTQIETFQSISFSGAFKAASKALNVSSSRTKQRRSQRTCSASRQAASRMKSVIFFMRFPACAINRLSLGGKSRRLIAAVFP